MKKTTVLLLFLTLTLTVRGAISLTLFGIDPDIATDAEKEQICKQFLDSGSLSVGIRAFDIQIANLGVFIAANNMELSGGKNYVVQDVIIPIDDPDILWMLGADSLIFADMAVPILVPLQIHGIVVDEIMTSNMTEGGSITLIDGDTFETMDILYTDAYYNLIPEPTTVFLLGIGAILIRRK